MWYSVFRFALLNDSSQFESQRQYDCNFISITNHEVRAFFLKKVIECKKLISALRCDGLDLIQSLRLQQFNIWHFPKDSLNPKLLIPIISVWKYYNNQDGDK